MTATAKGIRMDHVAMTLGHLDKPINATATRKRVAEYRAEAAELDADHLGMLADLERHFKINAPLTSQQSADMPTVTVTAESVRTAAQGKGLDALADKLEAQGVAPADAMAIINAAPAAAAPVEKKHAFSQAAAAERAAEPAAAAPEGVRADAVATARAMYGAKP